MNEILEDKPLEAKIAALELIPGTSGVYEVTVNGDLIFSKKTLGRHADPGEIYKLLKQKFG